MFQHRATKVFFALVGLGVVLRVGTLASVIFSNAGVVMLTSALLPAGHPFALAPDVAALARTQQCFEKSASLDSENSRAFRGLALSLTAAGKEAEAVKMWQIADPTFYDFLWLLDTAVQRSDMRQDIRWNRWAIVLQDMAQQMGPEVPGSSEVYYEWGRVLRILEERPTWGELLDVSNTAVERDRFFWEEHQLDARFQRAELLRQDERWEEALRDYEWVTSFGETYRGSGMWPVPYSAWAHQGHIYQSVYGDYERAQHCYEAAIEFNPGVTWAYLSLGALYREQGKSQRAQTMFERVLELEPCNSKALAALGREEAECSPQETPLSPAK